ncbi:MAG: hypothetical protein DCC75_11800 [Proteobacteria bacterium]|nr:MAG: hypothetical protein DCC75_11800 [Pseudomonadota bacterium]
MMRKISSQGFQAGPQNKTSSDQHSEICEIIETTIEDLDTLTKAFHVIRNVCEESQGLTDDFELESNDIFLN